MTSKNNKKLVASKNSHLSLVITDRDVLPGEMSLPQPQKFHTDDVYHSLHNQLCSQMVPKVNLFDFPLLLVDCKKVLSSSENALLQNSQAYSKRIYSRNIDCFVIDSSCLLLTFAAFCLLSDVCKQ